MAQPSGSFVCGRHGRIIVIKRTGADGTVFKFNNQEVRVGKDDVTLDIRVQQDTVSPLHCTYTVNKETKQVSCRSCNSGNPATLNDRPLPIKDVPLRTGDVIGVGTRRMRFEYPPDWWKKSSEARKSSSHAENKVLGSKVQRKSPVGRKSPTGPASKPSCRSSDSDSPIEFEVVPTPPPVLTAGVSDSSEEQGRSHVGRKSPTGPASNPVLRSTDSDSPVGFVPTPPPAITVGGSDLSGTSSDVLPAVGVPVVPTARSGRSLSDSSDTLEPGFREEMMEIMKEMRDTASKNEDGVDKQIDESAVSMMVEKIGQDGVQEKMDESCELEIQDKNAESDVVEIQSENADSDNVDVQNKSPELETVSNSAEAQTDAPMLPLNSSLVQNETSMLDLHLEDSDLRNTPNVVSGPSTPQKSLRVSVERMPAEKITKMDLERALYQNFESFEKQLVNMKLKKKQPRAETEAKEDGASADGQSSRHGNTDRQSLGKNGEAVATMEENGHASNEEIEILDLQVTEVSSSLNGETSDEIQSPENLSTGGSVKSTEVKDDDIQAREGSPEKKKRRSPRKGEEVESAVQEVGLRNDGEESRRSSRRLSKEESGKSGWEKRRSRYSKTHEGEEKEIEKKNRRSSKLRGEDKEDEKSAKKNRSSSKKSEGEEEGQGAEMGKKKMRSSIKLRNEAENKEVSEVSKALKKPENSFEGQILPIQLCKQQDTLNSRSPNIESEEDSMVLEVNELEQQSIPVLEFGSESMVSEAVEPSERSDVESGKKKKSRRSKSVGKEPADINEDFPVSEVESVVSKEIKELSDSVVKSKAGKKKSKRSKSVGKAPVDIDDTTADGGTDFEFVNLESSSEPIPLDGVAESDEHGKRRSKKSLQKAESRKTSRSTFLSVSTVGVESLTDFSSPVAERSAQAFDDTLGISSPEYAGVGLDTSGSQESDSMFANPGSTDVSQIESEEVQEIGTSRRSRSTAASTLTPALADEDALIESGVQIQSSDRKTSRISDPNACVNVLSPSLIRRSARKDDSLLTSDDNISLDRIPEDSDSDSLSDPSILSHISVTPRLTPKGKGSRRGSSLEPSDESPITVEKPSSKTTAADVASTSSSPKTPVSASEDDGDSATESEGSPPTKAPAKTPTVSAATPSPKKKSPVQASPGKRGDLSSTGRSTRILVRSPPEDRRSHRGESLSPEKPRIVSSSSRIVDRSPPGDRRSLRGESFSPEKARSPRGKSDFNQGVSHSVKKLRRGSILKQKRNSAGSAKRSPSTPLLALTQSRPFLRQRGVSFGPDLSPELIDKHLPPSTPVKKGAKPPSKYVTPGIIPHSPLHEEDDVTTPVEKEVANSSSKLLRKRKHSSSMSTARKTKKRKIMTGDDVSRSSKKPLNLDTSSKSVASDISSGSRGFSASRFYSPDKDPSVARTSSSRSVESDKKAVSNVKKKKKKLFSEILKDAKTPKRSSRVSRQDTDVVPKKKKKVEPMSEPEPKIISLTHELPKNVRLQAPTTGHANSPVTYVIGKKKSIANSPAAKVYEQEDSELSMSETESEPDLASTSSDQSSVASDLSLQVHPPTPVSEVPVSSRTRRGTPIADYTNVDGISRLFKASTPKADYSNVIGVRRVLRNTTPAANYVDVRGVKELLHPPKESDLTRVSGVKRTLRNSTPKGDYRNVRGLKELVHPPKITEARLSLVRRFLRNSTPDADYSSPDGLTRIFKESTPKVDLAVVKELFDEAKTANRRGSEEVRRVSVHFKSPEEFIEHLESARVMVSPLTETVATEDIVIDSSLNGSISESLRRSKGSFRLSGARPMDTLAESVEVPPTSRASKARVSQSHQSPVRSPGKKESSMPERSPHKQSSEAVPPRQTRAAPSRQTRASWVADAAIGAGRRGGRVQVEEERIMSSSDEGLPVARSRAARTKAAQKKKPVDVIHIDTDSEESQDDGHVIRREAEATQGAKAAQKTKAAADKKQVSDDVQGELPITRRGAVVTGQARSKATRRTKAVTVSSSESEREESEPQSKPVSKTLTKAKAAPRPKAAAGKELDSASDALEPTVQSKPDRKTRGQARSKAAQETERISNESSDDEDHISRRGARPARQTRSKVAPKPKAGAGKYLESENDAPEAGVQSRPVRKTTGKAMSKAAQESVRISQERSADDAILITRRGARAAGQTRLKATEKIKPVQNIESDLETEVPETEVPETDINCKQVGKRRQSHVLAEEERKRREQLEKSEKERRMTESTSETDAVATRRGRNRIVTFVSPVETKSARRERPDVVIRGRRISVSDTEDTIVPAVPEDAPVIPNRGRGKKASSNPAPSKTTRATAPPVEEIAVLVAKLPIGRRIVGSPPEASMPDSTVRQTRAALTEETQKLETKVVPRRRAGRTGVVVVEPTVTATEEPTVMVEIQPKLLRGRRVEAPKEIEDSPPMRGKKTIDTKKHEVVTPETMTTSSGDSRLRKSEGVAKVLRGKTVKPETVEKKKTRGKGKVDEVEEPAAKRPKKDEKKEPVRPTRRTEKIEKSPVQKRATRARK